MIKICLKPIWHGGFIIFHVRNSLKYFLLVRRTFTYVDSCGISSTRSFIIEKLLWPGSANNFL
jgi:hypothetical protein